MPTKITPRADHIVFYLSGFECCADSVDSQLVSEGKWQLWKHGIVNAVSKRLLAKEITGYRSLSYINGDKLDLRRRNLRNAKTAFWRAQCAIRSKAKVAFCLNRMRWIVRRQVSGVRLWKSCKSEAEAKAYAHIFSAVGAAELSKNKRRSCLDEQFMWLHEDISQHIVQRCESKVEIAQKAFAAGVLARDIIGKRNAEALCV